ncbi:sensor histidine kinase [Paenibacillus protaetiae]|uniref:histidine kinase n=1 Tax=Paenibacillus protaetiae TaxID=2509456 RepID=A0A4P6ERD9_9BACL|nr:HAMP domain-containing sensor histidine kinase [Paenibacillus protaetiae]QAY65015.1 HAMP domain-containing histidine kinase [Paenibacillus protaetiae]
MTIRLRLTLWYSGLLAATLLGFSIVIYVLVSINTYSGIKPGLKQVADQVDIVGVINIAEQQLNLDVRSEIGKNYYFQVVNYQDQKLIPSESMSDLGFFFPYPKDPGSVSSNYKKVKITINGQSYPFLLYQEPIYIKGTLVGLKQVGAYLGNEERLMAAMRSNLTLSSILVIIIAFTVGLFLARKALLPIDRVTRATEMVQGGSDLSVRIPLEGSERDEIGRLIRTLNVMLARLEHAYNDLDESYKMQRRFVSDASHELRTPLTTIRGNIELLEKMWKKQEQQSAAGQLVLDQMQQEMSLEAMQDISAEAKRMSTLVNDLLALARADAGYVMEKQELEVVPLLEEVARRAQLLPRRADWIVNDLSVLKGVRVNGNHDYLQQLVFIFIENAFKYTPQGEVELEAKLRDGRAGIVIKDTGIGMNPEEVPHIFDRFYRADESRGQTVGTGLGLSIAKWIIDEHKGSVEVETREGAGSTFTIWLPIAFSDGTQSSIIEGMDRANG